MKSDWEVQAAVSDAFVTWFGMEALQTRVISRPGTKQPYYAIERQFAIGTVVMYLSGDEQGHFVRDSAMWRVGHS